MVEAQELTRLARCLGGVPFLGCSWGGVAARIGLQRGDIVVAVNGVKTPDEMAFNYARSLRDDQLELEVIRDGQTLSFLVGRARTPIDPMIVLDEVVASRFELLF